MCHLTSHLMGKISQDAKRVMLAMKDGFDPTLIMQEFWVARELDHVNVSWYSVLLSYPDPNNPNKVELLDNNK